MSSFLPCVVVPVFDHAGTLPALVGALARHRIDTWLVDDGSEPGCASAIARLVDANPGWLRTVRLEVNQGKGAAVMAGLAAGSALIERWSERRADSFALYAWIEFLVAARQAETRGGANGGAQNEPSNHGMTSRPTARFSWAAAFR